MKSKEGMSEMWWLIGVAIVTMIVVILVVVFFSQGQGKTGGFVEEKISGLGDCDKDGVGDWMDKCKCDPTIGDKFPGGVIECSKKCPEPFDKKKDCLP